MFYDKVSSYEQSIRISTEMGNNALSFEKRKELLGYDPYITVPSLRDGTIDDVTLGDFVVFEEAQGKTLQSCSGLKNFVHIVEPLGEPYKNQHIYIFDNHNHALYFWIHALRIGVVKKGIELIHIDEHSDLWENQNVLNLDKALKNEQYAWEFTNFSCNVGNYIQPAQISGLIKNIVRIENEFQIDENINFSPKENSILNIDLDFFSPDLHHIPEKKKVTFIKKLLKQVQYVTIATSPFFIDQGIAIQKLRTLLRHD